MQKLSSVGKFHGLVPAIQASVTRGLGAPTLVKLKFRNARPPWAPTLPFNEEGFGTLSWQLGNNEGYRSSRVGVSGLLPVSLLPVAPVPQMQHRPKLRRMGGLRTAA